VTTPEQVASVINADLRALLRAGRVHFPDLADELSGIAAELNTLTSTLDTQSALCSDPPSFSELLGVNHDIYAAVRRCVLTMNDCGTALVNVAENFAASDDVARQQMDQLRHSMPGLANDQPAPAAPEPPPMADPEEPGAPGVTPR